MEEDFDISSIVSGETNRTEVEPIEVTCPSGSVLTVMTESEAKIYNEMSERYQKDNRFSNASDLAELDRILSMELMCHRWSQWIIQEEDYEGRPVDTRDLQKYIESNSKEIRGTKRDLGMDKSSRDKGKQASIGEYLQNLLNRGEEMGVHRDEQIIKAMTLWKELQGIVQLYDNSNESERREFNCNQDQIFDWMRSKFEEFDEIDEAFRQNQKMWVRSI